MQAIAFPTVEQFLYHEAWLIDTWQLQEWLALCTSDVQYIIPPLHLPPEEAERANPATMLCVLADDRKLLESRVARLLNRHAYAEQPRSRIRHLITNIVVADSKPGQQELVVRANFAVYRTRAALVDVLVGHYLYCLNPLLDGYRIRRRLAILDLDVLDPLGMVSFLL